MKMTVPGQDIRVDIDNGVEPIWYERLARMIASLAGLIEAGGSGPAYNEGTYTPSLTSAGGTAPTFTAVPLVGHWVRIGRMVTVSIRASNTVGGTPGAGTQQLSVTLPFKVATASDGGKRSLGSIQNGATEETAFGLIAAGSSTMSLYLQSISGSEATQVNMTGADLNNVSRSLSWFAQYGVD